MDEVTEQGIAHRTEGDKQEYSGYAKQASPDTDRDQHPHRGQTDRSTDNTGVDQVSLDLLQYLE